MDRNVSIIVGAAILAVALVASAFMFTHKAAPPVTITHDESAAQAACVTRGGQWHPGFQGQTGWIAGVCFGGI